MDRVLEPHHNTVYSLAFRERIYQYFKTHTARQTAEKFGLTHGQVIGILETGRRMGHISPRFKDTRDKTLWSFKERLSLIQMCGLIERGDIAKKLNRSNARNIKERMKKDFNAGTKFLHGCPKSWLSLMGIDPQLFLDRGIKTKAGPTGVRGEFKFTIIPWVEMQEIGFASSAPPHIQSALNALARFQFFIWQTQDPVKVRRFIEGVING